MTTTAETAVAPCEYCGRKDGTHDPECPVATGAADALRNAAQVAADGGDTIPSQTELDEGTGESQPPKTDYVEVDASKPHPFVAEPVDEGEEPVDQCFYCNNKADVEIHTSYVAPAEADTVEPGPGAKGSDAEGDYPEGEQTFDVDVAGATFEVKQRDFKDGSFEIRVAALPDIVVKGTEDDDQDEALDRIMEMIAERVGAAGGESRTTVDGQEAILRKGGKPAGTPIVRRKSLDEAMEDVAHAQAAYDGAVEEAKAATEAKNEAQKHLNHAIRAALEVYNHAHGVDPQLVLGE